eukprot:TRINITY_DN9219_c0_g1_i1.p1 TRINITY_DN9219_c0_g1~~TRINITY_DN9219_c0_g1_i1.p1  ORF type:complete len:719 (-),score=133.54 TRINITY_DN9219_c0_g1_i1:796-2952(-)
MKPKGGAKPAQRRGLKLSFFDRLIVPRLQHYAINHNLLDVDAAVDYLRTNYREYRRQKQDPFRKTVQRALEQLQIEIHNHDDNDEEDQLTSASSRKRSRIESAEKRLQEQEASYLAKKFRRESTDSESEESLLEDGSAKPRPFSDLMNSLIRTGYGKLQNPQNPSSNAISDVTTTKTSQLEEGGGGQAKENTAIENGCTASELNGAKTHTVATARTRFKPNSEFIVETNVDATSSSFKAPVTSVSGKEKKSSVLGTKTKVKSKGYEGALESRVSFNDLGGIEDVLKEIREVIYPLYHPELYPWLGLQPVKGILLHGPPGCGKTKLAHAIATETGVPFYKISATEVVSGVSGESEENIRSLFDKASKTAPSIIFIDEIDAISAKRESLQREMERRIVTQLLTCMDDSSHFSNPVNKESDNEAARTQNPGHVLVIGATNRPDALDPALRRPGRFDREIFLGIPDEDARVNILSVLTKGLRLEGTFELKKIARHTPGFVGADLTALTREAGSVAIKRILALRTLQNMPGTEDDKMNDEWWKIPWTKEELGNLSITMADFEEAIAKVQPSTRREGFSSIPNIKWEDVGALSSLQKEFELYIVRRIKHPEYFEALGMDFNDGFLLFGPPGCGKTLVAKAVANEAGANFIHIKGPELLNKYVGESELAVRTIFTRARTSSPCILFFDEIDALTTRRGRDGGWVVERLLNQVCHHLRQHQLQKAF